MHPRHQNLEKKTGNPWGNFSLKKKHTYTPRFGGSPQGSLPHDACGHPTAEKIAGPHGIRLGGD